MTILLIRLGTGTVMTRGGLKHGSSTLHMRARVASSVVIRAIGHLNAQVKAKAREDPKEKVRTKVAKDLENPSLSVMGVQESLRKAKAKVKVRH